MSIESDNRAQEGIDHLKRQMEVRISEVRRTADRLEEAVRNATSVNHLEDIIERLDAAMKEPTFERLNYIA